MSISMIEEIFDDLGEGEYLSTLDLFTGYWKVLMCECWREKTTILTRYVPIVPFYAVWTPERTVDLSADNG